MTEPALEGAAPSDNPRQSDDSSRPRKMMRTGPADVPPRTGQSLSVLVPNVAQLDERFIRNHHYIPYCGIGFLILNIMFNLIKIGRRSRSITGIVCELELRYMFSLLFFFRILHINREAGTISIGDIPLYDRLSTILRNRTIPGPLIEFFASFAIVADPHHNIRYIPELPPCRYADDTGILSLEMFLRFPCVPAILRGLFHVANGRAYDTNLNDQAAIAAPAPVQAYTLHARHSVAPGIQIPYVPPQAPFLADMQQRINRAHLYPLHPAQNWEAYLNINAMEQHLPSISDSWEMFCRYFKSNKYFNDISLTESGAGLILASINPITHASLTTMNVNLDCHYQMQPPALLQAAAMMPNVRFAPGSWPDVPAQWPLHAGAPHVAPAPANPPFLPINAFPSIVPGRNVAPFDTAPMINADTLSGSFWNIPGTYGSHITACLNDIQNWALTFYSDGGF